MTQSTILTAGVTQATSTDVVVAQGATATVGIFSATSVPFGVELKIQQDTPGTDNTIFSLNYYNRTTVLTGPGTFRVKRTAYTGNAVGVFLEV